PTPPRPLIVEKEGHTNVKKREERVKRSKVLLVSFPQINKGTEQKNRISAHIRNKIAKRQ
ncbi:MAG: hypothetical protein ACK559_08950, partial [bacterium]